MDKNHSTNNASPAGTAQDVTRVIDGQLCRMTRRPEPLTSANLRGVKSFERLLAKIDDARDDDCNVLRAKAIRLVRKAIEDVPREVLRGFECALAEYIAVIVEGTVPSAGYVTEIIENGEWFSVEFDEPKTEEETTRAGSTRAAQGDPQFQRFIQQAIGPAAIPRA